jgi:hypothetical protein
MSNAFKQNPLLWIPKHNHKIRHTADNIFNDSSSLTYCHLFTALFFPYWVDEKCHVLGTNLECWSKGVFISFNTRLTEEESAAFVAQLMKILFMSALVGNAN